MQGEREPCLNRIRCTRDGDGDQNGGDGGSGSGGGGWMLEDGRNGGWEVLPVGENYFLERSQATMRGMRRGHGMDVAGGRRTPRAACGGDNRPRREMDIGGCGGC